MARILITSALPGVNGVKHLGNVVGSLLPADIYARFERARGNEVLSLCGTDDHGTPAELAAAEAGLDVADYCAEQHKVQYDLGVAFGLSWDFWGRTSAPQTGELVHHFAAALEAHGLIEERVDKMVYSLTDKRFLPDRYVEGTCPVCSFRPARGDQCDNCGSLLDPVDLIEPYSVISGSSDIEVRDTRHLYQLHSKMADRIRAWTDEQTGWPPLARAIAYKHLDEGLIDRGITRDLAWGFPVLKDGLPRPGFEDKVYYVWFDDVLKATSASPASGPTPRGRTGSGGGGSTRARPTSATCSSWARTTCPFTRPTSPSTILGSEEPWKMVDVLKAFNWLNWYGGKVLHLAEARRLHGPGAGRGRRRMCGRWYLTANSP